MDRAKASMSRAAPPPVSDDVERFLTGDGDTTLRGLIAVFGPKSFALIFVLLLGVPALPLPTGGATHVFELIAILLALQLIAGREKVWLPRRWGAIELADPRRQRFVHALLRFIRRLERLSKPRARWLFNHRASNAVFGVLVAGGSLAAFLAPPFTGLDTLPSLGVVLVSLGFLLEDIAVVAAGVVVAGVGIALEIVLGSAALHGISDLFG
jgi:hypothetical protein